MTSNRKEYMREYLAKYYQEHKDYFREYQREYRKTHDMSKYQDKFKERHPNYARRYRDSARKTHDAWVERNREKWNAYLRDYYRKRKGEKMIKLSTINQIVEAILDEALTQAYKEDTDRKSQAVLDKARVVANEAAIYYKTAMICEDKDIDKAMEYFTGTHTEDEYQEFRTSMAWGKNE